MRNKYVGSGLCECGCGGDAPKWGQSYTAKGVVKGDSRRFIQGHYRQYQKESDRPRAACHPERAVRSKGLCASCYNRWLLEQSEYKRQKVKEARRARRERYKRETPPDVIAAQLREKRLKYRYGISNEDYEKMLSAQGGCCAICKKPAAKNSKGVLFVDHDHDTGAARGLLCNKCNNDLHVIEQGVERIQRLAEYLRTYAPDTKTWCALARLELMLRDEEAWRDGIKSEGEVL